MTPQGNRSSTSTKKTVKKRRAETDAEPKDHKYILYWYCIYIYIHTYDMV